jgi:hypothetical protein
MMKAGLIMAIKPNNNNDNDEGRIELKASTKSDREKSFAKEWVEPN